MSDPTRSSFCNSGECIEVEHDVKGDGVAVVRRRPGAEMVLHVSRDEFTAFVAGVKAGEFDKYTGPAPEAVEAMDEIRAEFLALGHRVVALTPACQSAIGNLALNQPDPEDDA